jgi:hypothetical protein
MKETLNNKFKGLALPILPFEVTDKLPQHVRVILSKQIRGLFQLRQEYKGKPLQQSALNGLLNMWWSNHWTMIKSASQRPEWSWTDLALLHSKQVTTGVQFVKAERDFIYFISGCNSLRCKSSSLTAAPNTAYATSRNTAPYLIPMYKEIFKEITYEGLSEKSKQHTPYLTIESVNRFKSYCETHNPIEDITLPNGRPGKKPKFQIIFDCGLGKLPEVLFADPSKLEDFKELLENNEEVFRAELYKYLGCTQTSNLSGKLTGPAKSTIVNKMLQLYFNFVAVNLIQVITLPTRDTLTMNGILDILKESSTRWVSNEYFKHRSEGSTGYTESYLGTFHQMYTRILEEVSGGTVSKEQFIVSYHPCDLITCSLGYNWSSCQSFINDLEHFPDKYGTGSSSYSGCYHAGDFHFMTGNGYIVYIPYVEHTPLFLSAKLKRMLMWTSNSLTSMRQNYFYPGKPTDSDSIALASSVREYLQNVYSNSNNTRGTSDWIAHKSISRDTFEYDTKIGNFFGYDDPIYKLSSVKEAEQSSKNLIYSGKIPLLNTSLGSYTYVGNSAYGNYSRSWGSYILASSGITTDTTNFIEALNADNEPISIPDYEAIVINDDLIVTLEWYAKHLKHLNYVDSKLLFKSKKYKSATGFKYTLELPSNVKACKHCGELFTEDLLVEGYCVACAANNSELSIIKIRDTFLSKAAAIEFDKESLSNFFSLMPQGTNITWKSGKTLSEFIPEPRDNVLVLVGTTVVLKSKAKNNLPVFNIITSKKGGEQ